MIIQTRDFGKMELDEQQLLEFVSPIFGFDDLKRYALLSDDQTGAGLMWLQSAERPETCFILLDPEEIGLNYTPSLPEEVIEQLELADTQPVVRVIAVVPDDFKNTTVNLKSPVVINPEKQLAAQVILDEDYPIRMRLFDEKEAGGC